MREEDLEARVGRCGGASRTLHTGVQHIPPVVALAVGVGPELEQQRDEISREIILIVDIPPNEVGEEGCLAALRFPGRRQDDKRQTFKWQLVTADYTVKHDDKGELCHRWQCVE